MIRRLKINRIAPIALLLLFVGQTSNAQLESMALLETLSAVSEADPTSVTDPRSSEETTDTDSMEKVSPSFEAIDYNFSGQKSFSSSIQKNEQDPYLDYFGYDFFNNTPSTYASAVNIPVPQDYVIGPNDAIKLILFGNRNRTYNLTVSREGEIFFPEIGPISVAGLSYSEMVTTIQDIVSNQLIGTQANITLAGLRSIDIFVLGEAFKPGMYTIGALSTLTNAVFKSGGIKITGSLREIELKRGGKTISEFDFYDLLLKGDTSKDARLMHGDVVFIPPITKVVGITGEVVRPAVYELLDNENIGDLLEYAGNLKPKAALNSGRIQRVNQDKNGFNVIPIPDLRNADSYIVQSGDLVKVDPVANNINNAVLISGHAQKNDFYPLESGMRISDILGSRDDLLKMTDLNYLLIKRQNPIDQSTRFIQADLEKIFQDNASEENLLLADRDELILFPSLLTSSEITTKIIEDELKYDDESDRYVFKDSQWKSLTYLRKSLMEEKVEGKANDLLQRDSSGATAKYSQNELGRYFEYSIYDYCTISEDLVIQILENTGFRAKKAVTIEELEKISTPEDFLELQRTLESDRIRSENIATENDQVSYIITNVCRDQIIKPLLDIIDRQNEPGLEKKTVQVFGNVHFPGVYPLTDQMILEDAINSAGGLKVSTYDTELELIRSNKSGKKYSVTKSSPSINSQIALKPMDIINVKEISTDMKTVKITGEVFFEGEYPIAENETIAELITRAGGIKSSGSIEAAIFQRQSIKESEEERLVKAQDELKRKIILSSQSGGFGQAEISSESIEVLTKLVVGDAESTEALGRLVIDLESIIDGSIDDIELQDGDSLHIPKTKQSVSVIGEVFVPNSHIIRKDLSIDDYVQMSGGLNDYADGDKIYIIKSDGSIISPSGVSGGGFFRFSNNSIEAGDTIVVPLQLQPFSTVRATTEITQIIYQLALAAAAVNSF